MTRILVVEDEPDVAGLVQEVLASEGWEVEVASGGKEALGKILANPPDLVILDLMMPEVDGFELLKLLRTNQATRNLPVLIMSARSAQQDKMATLQLQANGYISKPFSPAELVANVVEVLKASSGGGS